MKWEIQDRSLELVQGDITDQRVDAIVNAANSSLTVGGGVDGAIHNRGGYEINRENREKHPDGCPTGQAVVTGGGKLDCKYVIHAVGPVWRGGEHGESELLQSAYRQSLRLARQYECRSIAFPALSCGVYRFPIEDASEIAIGVATGQLEVHSTPELIRFVLFDRATLDLFVQTAKDLLD